MRPSHYGAAIRNRGGDAVMLFIAGLLVLIAVIVIPKLRVPFTADASLGWMSDRWLAEQRASDFHWLQ